MKQLFRKVPQEIRYLAGNFLILFVFFLLFRLVFFLFAFKTAVHGSHDLLVAWYLGAKFDVRLALILLIPVFGVVVFFPRRVFARPVFGKLLAAYFFITELAVLVLYVTDLGFYGYLGRRLDPTVLRFVNTQDAATNIGMVWESYPVMRGAALMVVVMILLCLLHRRLYRHAAIGAAARLAPPPGHRRRLALPAIILFILMAAGIYGNFDYYPLQWSQAMFSGDAGITSLGLNPVLNFFSKLRFRKATFDLAATRRYYPYIARYLGVQHPDSVTLNFERTFAPDTARPKPNIVFVMLESTGAAVTSMFGNPMQPTPNLRRLADSGVLFENFYVPAHSTARTVYGLTTGIPDITEVETASRHPDMIDQRVIMNEFKGYEKYYLLGGNMNWANIRALFTNNVTGVRLFEESDFHDKKLDVWGISDYDLVHEANKVFGDASRRGKPFVAFLQLADNHKPYSTTAGAGDFRPWTAGDIDSRKFKASGFISLGQLNALRYEDYNLGWLIRLARRSGYLKNTIFVCFGDHNCLLDPYHFMPLPEYEMGTGQVHVTAFIYSPHYFKPQRIARPASLLDLYATFAAYTGQGFTNYTLGTDIFDSTRKDPYDFIWFRKNGQLCYGMIGSRFLYEMQESTGVTSLYDLKADPLKDVQAQFADTARYLDHLLRGFRESTWYLMFNNKKRGMMLGHQLAATARQRRRER
jgi:phosphoglycerol transferase MdoB-like AlkP superfamily enzyme